MVEYSKDLRETCHVIPILPTTNGYHLFIMHTMGQYPQGLSESGRLYMIPSVITLSCGTDVKRAPTYAFPLTFWVAFEKLHAQGKCKMKVMTFDVFSTFLHKSMFSCF